MMTNNVIAQTELKRIWHYDPETGLFTRLVSTGNGKVGDVANCHAYGYIKIGICKKYYFSQRLAWLYMNGKWPKDMIDHINGIKDDNRWCNLRNVTRSINGQNQRKPHKDGTSGYAGVSWNKALNKWHAYIAINYKKIHLGVFDDVHEAGAYRLEMKRKLHEGCTL